MNMRLTKVLVPLVSLLLQSLPTYAETNVLKVDPEKLLRNATVIVEVHGFDKNSHEVTVSGSGFSISIEGYIVTARHLTDDAITHGASPESITYIVRASQVIGSPKINADVFWRSRTSDEMVLTAPMPDGLLIPLRPNVHPRGDIKLGFTSIFTGGFPEGYPLVLDRGIVRSFLAPENVHTPMWVTNMSFKHGQSGSPVILEDGTVVGIVTAIDQDASTIGFITPIRSIPLYLWDDFHDMLGKGVK
jgi:S1-C subfamily serine protease